MAKRRTREQILADRATDRRTVAIALAISGYVLRPCSEHSHTLLSTEDGDVRDVFKIADHMFEAGHLKHFFTSRAEMTDAIKAAVIEHSSKRCPFCDPALTH